MVGTKGTAFFIIHLMLRQITYGRYAHGFRHRIKSYDSESFFFNICLSACSVLRLGSELGLYRPLFLRLAGNSKFYMIFGAFFGLVCFRGGARNAVCRKSSPKEWQNSVRFRSCWRPFSKVQVLTLFCNSLFLCFPKFPYCSVLSPDQQSCK